MKKSLLTTLALGTCLLMTGCTKNYDTVEEYSKDMDKVKNSGSYVLEAKMTTDSAAFYYKTSVKGEKWKTEFSMNNGGSYMTTTEYDGKDVFVLSSGSPQAIISPINSIMGKEDPEMKKQMINSQNPTNSLINWMEDSNFLKLSKESTSKFINQKDKKNGFDCRMIKLSDTKEACIIDKYGIAAYQKTSIPSYKNPGTINEMKMDLVKIEKVNLDDSVFDLPKGVKKVDMNTALDEMMKNIGKATADLSKSMKK